MNISSILKMLFRATLCLVFIFLIVNTPNKKNIDAQKIDIQFMSNNIYKDVSELEIRKKIKTFLNLRDSLNDDINISLLEDLIMEAQYVKKAEVYLDIEDTLNVFIYFRTPFLKVLKNNKVYYCDSDGVFLPPLNSIKDDLLLVSGDLELQDFNFLLEFINKIYEDYMLNNLIGGVHYDNGYGYILSSKVCDLGISLGKEPLFDKKRLKAIELFSIFLLEELGCDYCDLINLEFDNQIICVK